jgi:cobalt-zinc-cadmium efflux system membrane fusion protein
MTIERHGAARGAVSLALAAWLALAAQGCGGRPGVGDGGAHAEDAGGRAGGTHDGEARAGRAHGGEAHGGAEHHGEPHDGEARDGPPAETVVLAPAAIRNAGIRVGVAGPAAIAVVAEAPGEVHLDAERVLEVRPRYDGVVSAITKGIGDPVRAGEVVARVQSNESLADYDVTAAMGGVVIARSAVAGQAVGPDRVLLTIADLASVWVDFAIYPQHVGRIRPGLPVEVVAHNRPDLTARGMVRYVGPLLEQDTRVSSARMVLPNPHGAWQPGLFVTARVELERARVPVAVPDAALVRTPEGAAVFVAGGGRFVQRAVTPGRSDGRTTEVVRGLAAGDSVVVAGAFVLRSELGKEEAGHEH